MRRREACSAEASNTGIRHFAAPHPRRRTTRIAARTSPPAERYRKGGTCSQDEQHRQPSFGLELAAHDPCRGTAGSRGVDERRGDSSDFRGARAHPQRGDAPCEQDEEHCAAGYSSHGSPNCTAMTAAKNSVGTKIRDQRDTAPIDRTKWPSPLSRATIGRQRLRSTRPV